MHLRQSWALSLASIFILTACDSKVVNQTIYNGNSSSQASSSPSATAQPSAMPSAAAATPQPSTMPSLGPSASPVAVPLSSCPKLDIRADGSWNIPRPDKTPRILKPGEYQLFPDGSAKITKPGEPDTGQIVKPPVCPVSQVSAGPVPAPSASASISCKFDIRADGSWNFPRPDKTPRILKPGEYQLFPDGSAKITKPGEPDTGQVVRPC